MAIICAQCGHRNTDGSRFCANPECKAFLAWTGQQGGPPRQAPPPEPSAPPPVQGDATRWGYDAGGHSDAEASMSMTDPELAVQPGETAATTVSVHNGGSQVEQFAVSVLGPTEQWAQIDPPVLVVYPDARGEAVIRWSPPREPTTVAGRAPFTVRAASILHPGLQVHTNGVLEIGEFREVTAALTPQTTAGRGRTTHRIQLANGGNVVEPVQLKATDPAGRMRFSLPVGDLALPPGSQGLDMTVRPPFRFFGRPVSQPFQVVATPRPPLPPVRLDGTREIVPLIAGWVPKVAIGLLAAGIVAAVMLVVKPFDQGKTAVNSTAGPSSGAATVAPKVGASGGGATPPPPPPPGGGAPAGGSAPPSSSATPAPAGNSPWAVVDATGRAQFSDGVAAVNTQPPGRTEVTFTRDVSSCVYTAAVAASVGQPVPDRGLVFTASGGSPQSVVVETRDIDGTLRSYPFHLQVRCSAGDTTVVAGGRSVRGTNQPRVTQTGTGQWEIRFAQRRSCAYAATIGDPGPGPAGTGLVSVGSGQQDPDAVLVTVTDPGGAQADLPFHLMTRCSGMFAVVGADGSRDRGRGVEDVSHPTPGGYEVTFDRNVSECSYVASVGSADSTPVDPGGEVFAAGGEEPDTVRIETRRLAAADGSGEPADFPFHLQVVC